MKSAAYLKYIRALPCCHTGQQAEPHHIIAVGMGKMGGKASDLHAVPLSRKTHNAVHDDPDSWPQIRWLLETQEQAVRDGVLVVTDEGDWYEYR